MEYVSHLAGGMGTYGFLTGSYIAGTICLIVAVIALAEHNRVNH